MRTFRMSNRINTDDSRPTPRSEPATGFAVFRGWRELPLLDRVGGVLIEAGFELAYDLDRVHRAVGVDCHSQQDRSLDLRFSRGLGIFRVRRRQRASQLLRHCRATGKGWGRTTRSCSQGSLGRRPLMGVERRRGGLLLSCRGGDERNPACRRAANRSFIVAPPTSAPRRCRIL